MGFLRSLFGIGTIHTHDEIKKNEKETQKWNDLLQEIMEYESSFNDYLKSVGIIDSYCADVEYVNNGTIAPVKREIENLRKKVDDYISLGGIGIGVRNLESLDDDINKVKYLKEIGQLNRQREFANDDSYTVQNKIEAEQEEIEQQKNSQENTDETNLFINNKIYTIEDIFKNNPIDIEEYEKKVNDLLLEYNDRKCADIIIYLISKFSIISFDEKISIIPEINKYILLYINGEKENEKCRWISYLFMMCYIQFSILSGEFADAKSMTRKLMENKELLVDASEFAESKYTLELWKNPGIFYCLYDTLYNMIQLCAIVKDDVLKEHIYEKYGFGFVKLIAQNNWEESIKNIDITEQYAEIRIAYWNSELEASYNVDKVNRIYLILDFALEIYYNYAYENMIIGALSTNSYNMEIVRRFESINGELQHGDYFLCFEYNNGTEFGNLYNLTSKIEKYNSNN